MTDTSDLVERLRERNARLDRATPDAMLHFMNCIKSLISDPTPLDRDAIAWGLAEKWPGDFMQGDDEIEREPNSLAYETADTAILALCRGTAASADDAHRAMAKQLADLGRERDEARAALARQDAAENAVNVAKESGADVHPRVAAIKASADRAVINKGE